MLPGWIWPVLDLWAACRSPGAMGGTLRHNPCSGGVGDQPAGLMEAFAMIDDIVAKRSATPA
jgi:hypothetical protein